MPSCRILTIYFTSSDNGVEISSSTELSKPAVAVESVSSSTSDPSVETSYQTATSSPTLSDFTATIDTTIPSDNAVIDVSTFSTSFAAILPDEATTLGDSTTTTDTATSLTGGYMSTDTSTLIDASVSTETTASTEVTMLSGAAISIDTTASTASTATTVSTDVNLSTDTTASTDSSTGYETTLSTDIVTSIEQTATADTVISAEPSTTEPNETIEMTVTTDTATSMDTTTTEFTTLPASESTTTTESLWASTTVASCPDYSIFNDDPSFEGENTSPNRWEYLGLFTGMAVPFQKQSSTSQEVPRAHNGDQFALLSGGPGSTVGTDMRRVLFLDSTKKYQIWFSFAAISHPDEDRIVNFIIATRNGHAWRELVNVPKGSPFVYRQETTIMQAAQDEWVVPFMRINAASTSRQVAVGDIYIAEYTPSCFKPTEKTDFIAPETLSESHRRNEGFNRINLTVN
ncbi:hypothetical protein ACLX1H_007392 [Fusarium chlamydosporum]